MQVAVDVTPRLTGATGVARYAAELPAALEHQGLEVRRYALGRAVMPVPPRVRRVPVPLRLLHPLWDWGGHPAIERLAGPADVYHTLDLVAPPCRGPSVATVHDLDALDHPHLHSPRRVRTQRAQLAALRRVRIVLSDTEATKAALARHGIDPERVAVTSLGVTWLATPPADGPPTTEGVDALGRPYVLAVGTVDLRKGQDVLVRALALLPDVSAVIAGPDQWRADEVRRAVEQAGVGDRVSFVGHVTDWRLAELYRGAAIGLRPQPGRGVRTPAAGGDGGGDGRRGQRPSCLAGGRRHRRMLRAG